MQIEDVDCEDCKYYAEEEHYQCKSPNAGAMLYLGFCVSFEKKEEK